MSELFDPATEKSLLQCSLSRKAQAVVLFYGDAEIAALDKLITMLVQTRNNWAEGGVCFAHGPYEGQRCLSWPKCITDPQQDEFIKEGELCVYQQNKVYTQAEMAKARKEAAATERERIWRFIESKMGDGNSFAGDWTLAHLIDCIAADCMGCGETMTIDSPEERAALKAKS